MMNSDTLTKIRNDFPILSRDIHSKPLIYLDSAASSQKPQKVIDAMANFMSTSYANVHRGVHQLASESTDAYEHSRRMVADFAGTKPEQIVFTMGATDAINMVASGFVGPHIKPGDEIIISVLEHHANIVPWHFLRERQGAVLKFLPMDDVFGLDLEQLSGLITPRTKMIALTHQSNVTGAVTDISKVVDIAHAAGIPVLLDGCQGAVHQQLSLDASGVDFYAFTAHKLYGPTGIGVLWAKKEHLEAMQPFRGGGEMIDVVTKDQVTYAPSPGHLEAGTPAIIEAVGFGAALEYLQGHAFDELQAHEMALAEHMRDQARSRNWLTSFAHPSGSGCFSFSVDGVHPHDLSTFLDQQGIAIRAGHHCAQPLMHELGQTATARASFGIYNTHAEVDAFFDGLDQAYGFFSRFR